MKRCSIGLHKWSKWEDRSVAKTFNQSYYRGMCGYTPQVTLTTSWQERYCLVCDKGQKKDFKQDERMK